MFEHIVDKLALFSIHLPVNAQPGRTPADGRHFSTGTRHMCSVVPTVGSSRRCVVEGFHVVQRGVVRGTEDGMKKWSKVRKLRCSCTVTLEVQTNTHLEQFQVLMNSEQRKMYGLLCLLILIAALFSRMKLNLMF